MGSVCRHSRQPPCEQWIFRPQAHPPRRAVRLRPLELFHQRDYAQARPHLYVKSLKSDNWDRAKGMRVIPSNLDIEILSLESGQWETIPSFPP